MPSSIAPRLAASMNDGPPPEQTTKWRLPSSSIGIAAGDPRQLARDVVIVRLGLQPLGDLPVPVGRARASTSASAFAVRARAPSRRRRRSRRCWLLQQQFGLQQLELEAHRAQILAQQEIGVLKGELVGGALGLRRRRHMLGGGARRPWRRERSAWAGYVVGHKRSGLSRRRSPSPNHAQAATSLSAPPPQSMRRVAYITAGQRHEQQQRADQQREGLEAEQDVEHRVEPDQQAADERGAPPALQHRRGIGGVEPGDRAPRRRDRPA